MINTPDKQTTELLNPLKRLIRSASNISVQEQSLALNHGRIICHPILEETPWYCPVTFTPTQSMPDWEDILDMNNQIPDLCSELNPESPWLTYNKIAKRLIRQQCFKSQLGDYPRWIHEASVP